MLEHFQLMIDTTSSWTFSLFLQDHPFLQIWAIALLFAINWAHVAVFDLAHEDAGESSFVDAAEVELAGLLDDDVVEDGAGLIGRGAALVRRHGGDGPDELQFRPDNIIIFGHFWYLLLSSFIVEQGNRLSNKGIHRHLIRQYLFDTSLSFLLFVVDFLFSFN